MIEVGKKGKGITERRFVVDEPVDAVSVLGKDGRWGRAEWA
jgi:hypothetical protein